MFHVALTQFNLRSYFPEKVACIIGLKVNPDDATLLRVALLPILALLQFFAQTASTTHGLFDYFCNSM